MKKIFFFAALLTAIFATFLLAQKPDLSLSKRWEKVNEFCEKQLPESALKEVEAILKQAQKEKNSEEVIKALVYKMRFTLEKDPDEAPVLITDFETYTNKSIDPSEKALLHSMTAELYILYYQSQAYIINQRTEVKGFVPDDMKEWTKNIFFDKISKHLSASLENDAVLQKTDALKYASLLEKGDDSRILQPTLFDFLANRRISILQQIRQATSNKNPLTDAVFFSESNEFSKFRPDTLFAGSVENQIIETYQQLLAFRLNANNIPALLFADLQRLKYVKEHTEISNSDSLYLASLNRLEKQFSENEAVVEVMAEKANYYLAKVAETEETRSYKKTAFDICSDGIKRFPNYKRIELLKNTQQAIIQKNISINYNEVAKPATNLKIKIITSNVTALQLTVYRLNTTAVLYTTFKQNKRNQKELFPDKSLVETRQIDLKSDPYFGTVNTEIELKTGDYGIYEFSLEQKDNKTETERALGTFTVSDLAFLNRTTEKKSGSLYVLDRQSGTPQRDVNVSVYVSKWMGKSYEIELTNRLKTDKNGWCQFPNTTDYSNNIFFFEKGKDRYFSSASYSYYRQQDLNETGKPTVNLFTDRSLYRPGQTVYFKGIAYYSIKNKQETQAGASYEVKLYDANNQELSTKKFKTNEFGSFAGEFVLPEGGLNGAFRIQTGESAQTIWVEEYKRPTFEVKIDKPKREVSFGEKVTLTGTVKAYAGYTLADAKVKYRVVRRTHRYCWWWSQPDKEITNGTTTSKADGTFEVTFIPQKTKAEVIPFRNEQFYSYTLYADVTDPKGETQVGEQTFSVGDKSLFILAEVPDKANKKEKLSFDLSTETLNGEKVNSVITYTLYSLAVTDIFAEKLDDKTVLKETDKVLSGTFNTKDKKLSLNLNKLASGRYKLVFTTPDAHGKEVKLEKSVVLYDVNDNRPAVKSYVWMLTPKTDCEVGEKALIRFGTSTRDASVLYEIMQGNTILESRWVSFTDEIKSFEIPFKESYGAGVTVMFTFVKDELFFTKSVQITRKVLEKKLTPTLSVFRNKLLPGEKAEWTVTIPESANNKKAVELLVGMYDASLDALRPHSWDFNPTYREIILYSPQWTSNGFHAASDYVAFRNSFEEVNEFQLDRLNWFGLSLNNYRGGRGPIRIRGNATMSKSENMTLSIADMKVAQTMSPQAEMITDQLVLSDKKADANAAEKPVQIRTNFNETAFFYPQLRTDAKGNVKFTFTAPESLTRWNVKMLAHSADLYFGQAEEQVVTQKDLMVQLNLPRFVRRSDKLVLSANVINLTDKEQKVKMLFELIDPITDKVVFTPPSGVGGLLTLAANETKAVEWELTEFSAYELVTCKVVARAGNFSDGEQKYLPVLPDQVLVTESMPMTIRGNQTRCFNFESLLKNGSNVDTKNLTVEFASNPTWYAVQALPTMAVPESNNAVDYFSAYYVNSLATFIANSNPKIAAVFDRWKKEGGSRDALLSNLEKNTELKNMLLEETPWVMAAKDETEQKRQIALLFDLNMQKNQAKQYMDKLMSLQLPSGGFSWFEGMPASRYVTQEIMLNLARLNRMTTGDSIPAAQRTMQTKALYYLDLEIARDFAELKKQNKNYDKEMSIGNMQLFYLHLRSEYPTLPVHVSALEAVKFYTSQSEKYWTNLTLYGKAMTAVVAQRNGKIQLANNILMSLKENALKTDEMGMYWARNTPGYFWNERPIAVQTGILEAFAEVSRNQADIDEMKLWLLKQKQTQRWDSPLATVDAIYALLHYGTDWLATAGEVKITLGNTLLKPQSVEAGTGYFKQTIPTADIRPETGKVTVSSMESGIGWGAMYWQHYQDMDKVTGQGGPLKISKKLFVERLQASGKTMLPIEQTKVLKGDKVITRLVITTDRNMEFVALKDLRAGCFEPVEQLSGCLWKEGVCYYKTTKDASTQFFFSFLPKGTYVFEYELWANSAGEYSSGIASVQCQYAPEFVSHSGGTKIKVN